MGIAAGLATADDVARREMIGLAATARTLSFRRGWDRVWCLDFRSSTATPPQRRVVALLLNIIAIVLAALCTYAAIRIKGAGLDYFKMNSSKGKELCPPETSGNQLGLQNPMSKFAEGTSAP